MSNTRVDPQIVKVKQEGKSLFIRIPKLMYEALSVSRFDFMSVRVENGELRGRKVNLQQVAGMVKRNQDSDGEGE